jgi:hypothetical protein
MIPKLKNPMVIEFISGCYRKGQAVGSPRRLQTLFFLSRLNGNNGGARLEDNTAERLRALLYRTVRPKLISEASRNKRQRNEIGSLWI